MIIVKCEAIMCDRAIKIAIYAEENCNRHNNKQKTNYLRQLTSFYKISYYSILDIK